MSWRLVSRRLLSHSTNTSNITMAIFISHSLLVISMYLLHVQAQYLDNRDDPYLSPYVRHSPASNHRSVSGIKQQSSSDDLPSSHSLFMMDFKRQAIVIPEPNEKLSSEYTL